jgi:DNA-binding MarR family transcriptional regulator
LVAYPDLHEQDPRVGVASAAPHGFAGQADRCHDDLVTAHEAKARERTAVPAEPARAERADWWPTPSDVAEQRGPIVHAIFRIARKNRSMASDLLRPLGLYAGQELLLLQLRENDGRCQQDLVDVLGIDHSTVTKMLQRLERAKMVTRHASADDRRVMLVSLTSAGRELCGQVEDIWAELEEASVGCLSSREREQLRHLLAMVEGQQQAPRRPAGSAQV